MKMETLTLKHNQGSTPLVEVEWESEPHSEHGHHELNPQVYA